MRAIAIITCAVLLSASSAHAQDALKRCRDIKEDAPRLKCYDAIGTMPPAPGESRGADGVWEVRDEKSPLDDTPLVTATLRSSDNRASLILRCKDRKTEVALTKWGFVKCGAGVKVIYRIDQQPAVDSPWESHSSCVLAISPSPIPFMRALTDGGKIYFRIYDHHDAAHDALFNLGKVSEVRSRVGDACAWK
jgi:hypothetical protein